MTAAKLYPTTMAAHAAPRSFADVVREKLEAGAMAPDDAVAAFVVCKGMDRNRACEVVAALLLEITA